MSSCDTELLLKVLSIAIPTKSATLVSGPIASGRGIYLTSIGVSKEEVAKENRKRLQEFSDRIRSRSGRTVICAANLWVPNWRGKDYETLLSAVIEAYVTEAWYIDGWQYSIGSIQEFTQCWNLGLPCRGADGSLISQNIATSLISKAIEDIQSLQGDASRLSAAFDWFCRCQSEGPRFCR